jgi:exonuclease III
MPQHSQHRGLPFGGRNRKLHIVAWSVQNMKTITKLDQLLALMTKHKIDILIMSEINITDSHTFYQEGFQISYSGEKTHPNAGVAFIIAPHIRPYIMGFTPHTLLE